MTDPLPSWNDGATKRAIVDFVNRTIAEGGPDYVRVADRVALFDNDGTLWVEQPMYTQLKFVLDDVKKLAPQHPEWRQQEPFKAVLANDREKMAKFSEADWELIVAATHAGMSTEVFLEIAKKWLATAKDPRFRRLYTELVYQPMLEVMDYLRRSGFKTYIVTGGGQEFVRVYSQRVYGVPPEQVVPMLDRILWRPNAERTLHAAEIATDVQVRRGHRYFIDEFLDHIGAPMGAKFGDGP